MNNSNAIYYAFKYMKIKYDAVGKLQLKLDLSIFDNILAILKKKL